MSDVLLGAVIALTSVFLTLLFDVLKRASEERRWYAEFFLGRKVEALHNLHTAVVEGYFLILRYKGVSTPEEAQQFKIDVGSPTLTLARAYTKAILYLDRRSQDKIDAFVSFYNEVAHIIADRATSNSEGKNSNSKDYSLDLTKLDKGYIEATELLRQMLNPPALRKAARLR